MNKEYIQKSVDKVIAAIENGIAPWTKPWVPGALSPPFNPVTGKPYRGSNIMMLSLEPFGDPRWMTYKQAQSIGAQVRKGEKGTPIFYVKKSAVVDMKDGNGNVVLDDNGKPKKKTIRLWPPRMFYAVVFNAEQIDGLPPLAPKGVIDPSEINATCAAMVENYGVPVIHRAVDSAYYSPSKDCVVIPEVGQFKSIEGYYGVLLHELIHSTGHETRLNRNIKNTFGSKDYGFEELVAALGGYFLAAQMDLPHDPSDSIAYTAHWAEGIKADPDSLFRAAALADKAAGYLLTFAPGYQAEATDDDEAEREGAGRSASAIDASAFVPQEGGSAPVARAPA